MAEERGERAFENKKKKRKIEGKGGEKGDYTENGLFWSWGGPAR